MVFLGKLSEEGSRDRGIWIERNAGKLQLAVRTGTLVEVGPTKEKLDSFYSGKLSDQGVLTFVAYSASDSDGAGRRGFWSKRNEETPTPVILQRDLLLEPTERHSPTLNKHPPGRHLQTRKVTLRLSAVWRMLKK